MSSLTTQWGEKKDVRGLDTVRVSKATLLEKLKSNRSTHLKEYTEAVKQYRELEVLSLTKVLKEIKTSINETIEALEEGKVNVNEIKDPFWLIHTHRRNQIPANHLEEYDTAIAKLEMSVDEYIELDDNEFDSFVMDNWDWKNQFKSSTMALNTAYTATALGGGGVTRGKKK